MNKKRSLLKVLFLLFVLAVGFFLPLPVYIETVGSAQNVADYVTVAKKKDVSKGKLLLTYVRLAHATPLLYVASFLDRNAERIPAFQISGGDNDQKFNLIQSYYMESAVNQAKISALKMSNSNFQQNFQGIYVLTVLAKSTFKQQLKTGDLITRVDGQKFNSQAGMIKDLSHKKVNQKVKISYERDKKRRQAVGKVIKITKTRNGIGVELAAKTAVKSDPKIKTDMDGIGGPSAGLMLALQMYSQLTGDNLKKGRIIAGTGTISTTGQVGEIGGIDKKVIAAKRAGATIFLSPTGSNYRLARKTAKRLKLKIKIKPVKTLKQAVNFLEQ
jgi:PDZ domain-containing protein